MSFNNSCLVSTSLFPFRSAGVVFDGWRLTVSPRGKCLFSPLAGRRFGLLLTVSHHMSSISTVVASNKIWLPLIFILQLLLEIFIGHFKYLHLFPQLVNLTAHIVCYSCFGWFMVSNKKWFILLNHPEETSKE